MGADTVALMGEATGSPTDAFEVITLALNIAQTCFLAWLAARYRR